MNIRWLLFSILCFSFTACHYYKKYDKESFPTYTWKEGQEIIFHPTIDDTNTSYQLTLGIRHLFGFQPSSIGIRVKSIAPSGREVTKEYDFQIRNANKKYIGTCGGDLCDLETAVDNDIRFEEKGQYTFILTPVLNTEKVPGVMEIGLILDKND